MTKAPVSAATREFGERVRARRAELGKSQEELARDSSLHWSYVGQVERGQRNPTLHSILKLAEVLDLDPADLVRGLRPPGGDAGPGLRGLSVGYSGWAEHAADARYNRWQ